MTSPMAIFDPVAFHGTISNGTSTSPARFVGWIDDEGSLGIEFDPLSATRDDFVLFEDRNPLQPMAALMLRGTSDGEWRFSSDQFYVTSWSYPDGEIRIAGYCTDAELSRDVVADHNDMRAWFVRKLDTIHGIEKSTALGRLVFVGCRNEGNDAPSAILALHADGQELEGWWDESERFLIHIQRILSLACGSYIIPIFEQRVRAGVQVYRTAWRGRSPTPYLPAFDMLFMDQIFDCAVKSFAERSDVVVRLDPAIRWMTASAAYEESRLINAMSALECIVAQSGLPSLFMEDEEMFRALRAKVRRFLKTEKAPSRMGGKVDELNRRSFRDKVEDLLESRSIVTADFPDGWLASIITARNVVVHTGVAPHLPSPDARLLDHIVWAREIVTRIILDGIGFEGQYRSWLHRDTYLSFPGCRPMSEIAAEMEAARARHADIGP